MAELSEKQLLLLDNLMYFDGICWEPGTSVKKIADSMIRNAGTPELFSGGFEKMSKKQIIGLATEISNDEVLSNLRVSHSVDKNSTFAICFEGNGKGDATVAIRGTGGTYEAWKDNVTAAADTDSKCQETIGAFLDELGDAGYHDITITGHSKGGNLAQYATITKGNLIDHCCSFDGQGFSKSFLDKYTDEVAKNADKIKSICGDDDYVNIILDDSYIKNKIYIDVNNDKLTTAHSSYELLTKGEFDQKGYFTNPVPQSDTMKMMDILADKLVGDLHKSPLVEKALVELLGAIAGICFAYQSGTISLAEALSRILTVLGAAAISPATTKVLFEWLKAELVNLPVYKHTKDYKQKKTGRDLRPVDSRVSSSAPISVGAVLSPGGAGPIYVSPDNLLRESQSIEKNGNTIRETGKTITEIANNLEIDNYIKEILKPKLEYMGKVLGKKGVALQKLGKTGQECSKLYVQTEKGIYKS